MAGGHSSSSATGRACTCLLYTSYIRNVSQWITTGNGSNIAGLTSITAGVTSGASGTVTYKDIISLITTLDPAYTADACLAFNTATMGYVLEIQIGRAHV